jgi:hypothetical protein
MIGPTEEPGLVSNDLHFKRMKLAARSPSVLNFSATVRAKADFPAQTARRWTVRVIVVTATQFSSL